MATTFVGMLRGTLASHPLRSVKRGMGERDVAVAFAGVMFRSGAYLYADEDGVVVAPAAL